MNKLESLIEVALNVGSGFLVSWAYWAWVMSALLNSGALTVDDGFMVTTHYTALAVIRGYLWRRFFARGLHLKVHKWVTQS